MDHLKTVAIVLGTYWLFYRIEIPLASSLNIFGSPNGVTEAILGLGLLACAAGAL